MDSAAGAWGHVVGRRGGGSFQTSLGKKKFFPFFIFSDPRFPPIIISKHAIKHFWNFKELMPHIYFREMILYLAFNGKTSLKSPVIGIFTGINFSKCFSSRAHVDFPLKKKGESKSFTSVLFAYIRATLHIGGNGGAGVHLNGVANLNFPFFATFTAQSNGVWKKLPSQVCRHVENLKKEAFFKKSTLIAYVKLLLFRVLDDFCTFNCSEVRFYSAYTKKAPASKLIQNDWAGKIEKALRELTTTPPPPLFFFFAREGKSVVVHRGGFFYFPAKKGGEEGEEEFTGHSLKRRETHTFTSRKIRATRYLF